MSNAAGSKYVYHVTHRCHNRSFLFRFACDRDEYRERLRQAVKAYELSVLGYTITANHTHMLIHSQTTEALSAMMQKLEGEFAEYYNIRKRRSGAFWGGRYHATMIDNGDYFWNCLKYIDLNMVRAGVVAHPLEWRWSGFAELVGLRKRYRIIDLDEVIKQSAGADLDEFRVAYQVAIDTAAARGGGWRDPMWTESIAVGKREFVSRVTTSIGLRREVLSMNEHSTGVWTVRETGIPYDPFSQPESPAKNSSWPADST